MLKHSCTWSGIYFCLQGSVIQLHNDAGLPDKLTDTVEATHMIAIGTGFLETQYFSVKIRGLEMGTRPQRLQRHLQRLAPLGIQVL